MRQSGRKVLEERASQEEEPIYSKICSLSTILHSVPSFASGLSRLLDLGSTLSRPRSPWFAEQSDFYALLSDWQAIGSDMWAAVQQFERDIPSQFAHQRGERR